MIKFIYKNRVLAEISEEDTWVDEIIQTKELLAYENRIGIEEIKIRVINKEHTEDDIIASKYNIYDISKYNEVGLNSIYERFGMSTRLYNCLSRSNICTLADLLKLNEKTINKIRNLGRIGQTELRGKIEEIMYNISEIDKINFEKEILHDVRKNNYISLETRDFKKSANDVKLWLKRFHILGKTKEEIMNELMDIEEVIMEVKTNMRKRKWDE